MINPNDALRYSNVISYKCKFHFQEFDKYLTGFLNEIAACKATIEGPLFYSLNNVPMNEEMDVEFFIQVQDDYIQVPDGFFFHSYYSIENMISMFSFVEVENMTTGVYSALLIYIEENGLQLSTPIFHILSGDEQFHYVHIKMGVMAKNLEDLWK
jgi:hypothetical protein